ncbi:hypothetical protein BH09ACT7_BH09ACT7_56360 [soil metagenome]
MNDSSISKDLRRFFGAYFHQDWDVEADDWEGIVDGYANDFRRADLLNRLANEIDELRKARPEPDLKHFLVEIVGVYYAPEPVTHGTWLGQVADRLRQRAVEIESGSADHD